MADLGVTVGKAADTDYASFFCKLMPKHFRNPDPAQQFAPHHQEFFKWGWDWTTDKKPACLWIVNRGGAKSTSTAGLIVGRAARKLSKYWLVITRTEPQGETHVRRVASMLSQSGVGAVYPGMAKPEVKEVGNRKIQGAWNRTMLTTADGLVLQSFSLLQAIRGVGYDEFRPDGIWVTDVDDEHDSVGMVETLENALASSVLATMASGCMVVFDQNLIHRGSVLNRIYTRKTDILSDRVEIGPVPALFDTNDQSYERRNNRWYIRSGRPSWPGGMPIEECETKVNLWGLQTWQREAQHNINLAYPDAVYPMWNEAWHVITWSEFAEGFIRAGNPREWFYDQDGKPRLPDRGKVVMAQDWGNRDSHPCANAWCWTPSEEMRMRNLVFFYREMCWPQFPSVQGDNRAHPSALQVGEEILNVERRWNEAARMQWRLASHERPEIVQAYRVDMPKAGLKALNFAQINTASARSGILHMQNFLTLEPDKLHPFSFYPEGHPLAGQPLRKSPKVFFIVADGQGELYFDRAVGQLVRKPALDEHGHARARFEYPNFRKPDTSDGAERRDPPKIDDDVIDCHRAIAGLLFPAIEKMTDDMRAEAAIPQHLQKQEIAKLDDQKAKDAALQGRHFAIYEAQRHMQQNRRTNAYGRARQRYPNSF